MKKAAVIKIGVDFPYSLKQTQLEEEQKFYDCLLSILESNKEKLSGNVEISYQETNSGMVVYISFSNVFDYNGVLEDIKEVTSDIEKFGWLDSNISLIINDVRSLEDMKQTNEYIFTILESLVKENEETKTKLEDLYRWNALYYDTMKDQKQFNTMLAKELRDNGVFDFSMEDFNHIKSKEKLN